MIINETGQFKIPKFKIVIVKLIQQVGLNASVLKYYSVSCESFIIVHFEEIFTEMAEESPCKKLQTLL